MVPISRVYPPLPVPPLRLFQICGDQSVMTGCDHWSLAICDATGALTAKFMIAPRTQRLWKFSTHNANKNQRAQQLILPMTDRGQHPNV